MPAANIPAPKGLLDDLRVRIDAVDRTLLAAVAERMRIAGEIGARKAARGLGVHAPERESRLLERLTKGLSAEDATILRSAFEVLIAGSRRRQLALRPLPEALPDGDGLPLELDLPEETEAAEGLAARLLAAMAAGGVVPDRLVREPGRLRLHAPLRGLTADRLGLLLGDLAGLGARIPPAGSGAASDGRPGRGLLCGLIGRRLPHTLSPEIHAELADYAYKCFEVEPEALGTLLQLVPLDGANVTIPYKEAVMPFCSSLTDRARRVGAVNTLVREPDGSLSGDNTDYAGFLETLRRMDLTAGDAPAPLAGRKALVLGSGGASKCCVAVLEDLGAETVVVSRRGPVTYADLPRHADAEILVNATPVGMFPDAGVSPVPDLSVLPALRAVVDLVYNPTRTQLLLDAEARGIPAANGLLMLVVQAVEASRRFLHGATPAGGTDAILRHLEDAGRSIVLTGMPGSGKSTIAALLAERLGRELVDIDAEVEREAGRSIPEIFRESGEEAFRDLESIVTKRAGARRGIIIATGGGTLLRKENRDALRSNGTIVLVRRPIGSLPLEGRPVSQARGLERLWQERRTLYEGTADLVVENDMTPEAAADAVIRATETDGR